MEKSTAAEILELLWQAHRNSLKISYENSCLFIESPNNSADHTELLATLKENEEQIIRHLSAQSTDHDTAKRIVNRRDRIEHNGKIYYEIPKIHHHYWWVDNSVDFTFKENVFIINAFRISGPFKIEVAERTFRYILERHEVLRTTYHDFDNKYYLSVEDPYDSRFYIEVIDKENTLITDDVAVGEFINFKDHYMDLKKGPFLKVRIVKKNEHQYIVSFKIHHCVYDGWSLEILKRDILTAYAAFDNGTSPDQPKLEFQYKDYMYLDYCFRSNTMARHRNYWQSTCSKLPEDIKIPGEHLLKQLSRRPVGYAQYHCSESETDGLELLATKFKVSLFILLQSVFNQYIQQYAGARELVIGTMLFNRDFFIGLENHIGPFARTYVIRTELPSSDFSEIVGAVKKANEDTKRYAGFALLDVLSEMLPENQTIQGSFWKFNLYYQDAAFGLKDFKNKNKLAHLNAELYPLIPRDNLLNINIELRFIKRISGIDIKVSFDKEMYTPLAINSLIKGFLSSLRTTITRELP